MTLLYPLDVDVSVRPGVAVQSAIIQMTFIHLFKQGQGTCSAETFTEVHRFYFLTRSVNYLGHPFFIKTYINVINPEC